jgi:hypothetical protein
VLAYWGRRTVQHTARLGQYLMRGQRQAEELLSKLEIELELKRSEFAVLKLQTRERIASLELQHAAAA